MRAATERLSFVPFLDLAVDECFRSTKMHLFCRFARPQSAAARYVSVSSLNPGLFTPGYSQACRKRRGTRDVGWRLVALIALPVVLPNRPLPISRKLATGSSVGVSHNGTPGSIDPRAFEHREGCGTRILKVLNGNESRVRRPRVGRHKNQNQEPGPRRPPAKYLSG